jgi:hypothetical protein
MSNGETCHERFFEEETRGNICLQDGKNPEARMNIASKDSGDALTS